MIWYYQYQHLLYNLVVNCVFKLIEYFEEIDGIVKFFGRVLIGFAFAIL